MAWLTTSFSHRISVKNMNPHSLIGSWLLINSEVQTLEPKCEIYHFRDNGRFDMQYPNGIGGSATTKLFHTVNHNTIHFGSHRNDLLHSMRAEIDELTLIILGNHGMESYFNKLTFENSPEWCISNQVNYNETHLNEANKNGITPNLASHRSDSGA